MAATAVAAAAAFYSAKSRQGLGLASRGGPEYVHLKFHEMILFVARDHPFKTSAFFKGEGSKICQIC